MSTPFYTVNFQENGYIVISLQINGYYWYQKLQTFYLKNNKNLADFLSEEHKF